MRIYYRRPGSSVGISGSPLAMYLLCGAWFMITLALTAVGLATAMVFGVCWLIGRLLRPRWPQASAAVCAYSSRAAHGMLRAIDVMNGRAS